MKLAPNFTLEEFLRTSHKVNNSPPPEEFDAVFHNLELLALTLLQPIRERFGVIFISSGYRSHELNELVKGKASSDHLTGRAADFKVFGTPLKTVWEWIDKSPLMFYQNILECGNHPEPRWIHLALPRKNDARRMSFTLP